MIEYEDFDKALYRSGANGTGGLAKDMFYTFLVTRLLDMLRANLLILKPAELTSDS